MFSRSFTRPVSRQRLLPSFPPTQQITQTTTDPGQPIHQSRATFLNIPRHSNPLNFPQKKLRQLNHVISTPRRYRADRWNNQLDGIPDAPDSRQFNGFDSKNFTPNPGSTGQQREKVRTSARPKDLYEKNAEKPDPKLEDSRFMKFYGMQRNEFGHEAGVTDDARRKAERWMWSEMVKKFPKLDGPARFGSHYHKMLTRKFANKKRDAKLANNRFSKKMDAILHGALSIGTFITVMYESDAGWRGLILVAALSVLIGIVFPLFLVLVMFTWLGQKWRNRSREAERLAILAKYGEEEDELEKQEGIHPTNKKYNSAENRLKRIKALQAAEPTLWEEVLITLGLKKENKNDAETLVGGMMKVIDIDHENFDPKQFWVKKFPYFDWTVTGTGSDSDSKPSPEQMTRLGRDLQNFPSFNALELKQQLLELQTAQVREIRDQGPKGMLDFVSTRLQSEQEELRLDRDVLLMNIDRVVDLLKKNMQRYKSAVRMHRPGHVLQLYEETIDGQQTDLKALREDLASVDERGWELKRRLEIIQQSLHNAIYSNLNGIEHPVVNDFIKSDLQQVLFGHMPSDLLDQRKLFELAALLAPLQSKLIKGKLSLDQVGETLFTDFGYFFPDSYNFNDELPHISKLSQANTTRSSSFRIQHVLEPLINSGPATQRLIQVAVADFDEEFQNKFSSFDRNSDGRRVQYIKEQKAKAAQELWDRSSYYERLKNGLDKTKKAIMRARDEHIPDEFDEPTQEEIDQQRKADREKFELQTAKFQTLRTQSLKEREDRQFRYESNAEQFNSVTRRQLGAFGKDFVGKASNVQKQFDVPIPANYEKTQAVLFLKDGSFVGGYDKELKGRRDEYNMEWLLEREKAEAISLAKKQQDEIISGVAQDPRLLHQLETDRIAFGTPIVTNREHNLHEYNKFAAFIAKFPSLRPDDYGTKDYQSRMESLSNASPEFWSGSMFQDKGGQIKPIASLYDTLPRTIATALGFGRKDSDFEFFEDGFDADGNPLSWTSARSGRNKRGNFVDGPQWAPTMYTKADIEQAGDVALRKAFGQQQSMYQKWQGTLAAAQRSQERLAQDERKYDNDFQLDSFEAITDNFSPQAEDNRPNLRSSSTQPNLEHSTSHSHWRRSQPPSSEGHRNNSSITSDPVRVDNSHLQIDTTHAKPIPALGPISEQLRNETKPQLQRIEDRLFPNRGTGPINPSPSQQQAFADRLVNGSDKGKYTINIGSRSKNQTPHFSSTQVPNPKFASKQPIIDDIDQKFAQTFPDLNLSAQTETYNPAKAALAAEFSPLLGTNHSNNDPTPPKKGREQQYPSRRSQKNNVEGQWDLSFDDTKNLARRPQMSIIKELVRKEKLGRVTKLVALENRDQNTVPANQLNNAALPNDEFPRNRRGPESDLFMSELKAKRISTNW